jgi:hypothetical protein
MSLHHKLSLTIYPPPLVSTIDRQESKTKTRQTTNKYKNKSVDKDPKLTAHPFPCQCTLLAEEKKKAKSGKHKKYTILSKRDFIVRQA